MKDELFFKPYPHLPCYAVGILLALALRRYRQQGQVGMSKVSAWAWACAEGAVSRVGDDLSMAYRPSEANRVGHPS